MAVNPFFDFMVYLKCLAALSYGGRGGSCGARANVKHPLEKTSGARRLRVRDWLGTQGSLDIASADAAARVGFEFNIGRIPGIGHVRAVTHLCGIGAVFFIRPRRP